MKKLLILTFVLQSLVLNSQKVFLDEYKVPLKDSSAANYYKIVDPLDSHKAFVETIFFITGEKESETYYIRSRKKILKNGKSSSWYRNGILESEHDYIDDKLQDKGLYWYQNGQLKSEAYFSDGIQQKRGRSWFENGQLKSEIEFTEGQYNGSVITYWKNGKLKRKDSFIAGKFENGICYDSSGMEIPHFDYEKMPVYSGGERQLMADIVRNTNYPIKSKNAGIQGKVIVRFKIDKKGNIGDIEAIQGVNDELDHEAIRVLQTLRKFQPAYCDGEPVVFYYMVPISFTLR